MIANQRKPAHAAPHRIITRRKPNRRPEATTYYPSDGQVAALAYLADMRGPSGI
jgi:hypothetical protein